MAGDVGTGGNEYGTSHYAAHAAVGCASSVAGGGKCGAGALSAVAGLGATQFGGIAGGTTAGRFAYAAVAGGVASRLAGGSFIDGAQTAAYGFLFNCLGHECLSAVNQMGDPTDNTYPGVGAAQIAAGTLYGGAIAALAVGEIVAVTSVKSAGNYLIYEGIDSLGAIRYVGITAREAAVRWAEHAVAFGTGKELLQYRVVVEGLTNIQARVGEQIRINALGLQRNGGQLLNRINSVASKYWEQYGIK
jgi:hypothetical protein